MHGTYRLLNALIFLACWLCSIHAHASAGKWDVFADLLYWHTTETVEWGYTRETADPSHGVVTYKTIEFGWNPGFRVGLGYRGCWDTQLYYTQFSTHARDSAVGTVVSAFLGSRVADTVYRAGQVYFAINMNMLDWDLKKSFALGKSLVFTPLIGLKGGRIHQTINTHWQGDVLAVENIQNNFSGVGPKGGVNSKWLLGNIQNSQLSLLCDFSAAYLWGSWKITDRYESDLPAVIEPTVGNRTFGAFMLQGLLGLQLDFCCGRMPGAFKLGYELEDWLNQYQVLDNETGTHNNDLWLQGLNLSLRLRF